MSTILVLDDQPPNRQLLVSLLGYRGHRVLEAEDGLRALEVVRAERPDLVIADVLMPVMDGYEFVHRLRRDPQIAGTTVMFYTANYLEREARALANDCGVNLLLTKPSEPEAILALVDRALNGHTPDVSPPRDDDFSRQHSRLLTDKLAAKVEALEAASARLTTLVRVGQQLAAETGPQRLVAAFCREAREIVGSRLAAIGILSDSGTSLRQFAVEGAQEDRDEIAVPAPRAGVFGRLLADSRPVRVASLDPTLVAALPGRHQAARSFLGVSIRTGAAVYGWMYFVDKIGDPAFSEDDEHMAALLAPNLAVAYENARRLERIQQHAAELEHRVAERTEALTRSNADLAQFAYVASHDLQEPLRMVASYTELLAKRYRGRLDDTADEFIGYAVDGARRMQDLIRDLLAYSRVESQMADCQLVPLDRALDNALANLGQAIEDSHAVITREPLPVVDVVESQFMQLFQNLIGNAIKFRGEQAPDIRIAAELIDQEWAISVSDNGIGIAPEFAERVFVIFQRLHSRATYSGTGMGLAICKRIVERHGGRLSVRSTEGHGAAFHFTIPAGRRSAAK